MCYIADFCSIIMSISRLVFTVCLLHLSITSLLWTVCPCYLIKGEKVHHFKIYYSEKHTKMQCIPDKNNIRKMIYWKLYSFDLLSMEWLNIFWNDLERLTMLEASLFLLSAGCVSMWQHCLYRSCASEADRFTTAASVPASPSRKLMFRWNSVSRGEGFFFFLLNFWSSDPGVTRFPLSSSFPPPPARPHFPGPGLTRLLLGARGPGISPDFI